MSLGLAYTCHCAVNVDLGTTDATEETLAHTVLAGRTPGSSEALPLVLSSVLLEAQTSSPAAYSGPTCLQKGPAVLQTQ